MAPSWAAVGGDRRTSPGLPPAPALYVLYVRASARLSDHQDQHVAHGDGHRDLVALCEPGGERGHARRVLLAAAPPPPRAPGPPRVPAAGSGRRRGGPAPGASARRSPAPPSVVR